jgi:hypothetical protein
MDLPELDLVLVEGSKYKSIAEAYNHAQTLAKYPVMAFIHDDMDLGTPDWLIKLLSAFANNADLGMVGLVGTNNVDLHSPFWWDMGPQYIYGSTKVRDENPEVWCWNKPKDLVGTLNCLDGSFMASRIKIEFDETLKLPELFLSLYEQDTAQYVLSKGWTIGIIDHQAWHRCKLQPKYHLTYKEDAKDLMGRFRDKWTFKTPESFTGKL